MALNDGAADRESYAHSIGLCRVESGKEVVGDLPIYTGSGVLDFEDGHLRICTLQ